MRIINEDVLKDYTYQPKIAHPIFSDPESVKLFLTYTPLQLSVYYDYSPTSKLLLEKTLYKASTLLPNGDNILHLLVSQKFCDGFILQKLLEKLEKEVGSKEQVKEQFLLQKSARDGLDVLEYSAGNNVPVAGMLQDNRYNECQVMDVEIKHDLTIEEEEKIDKKQQAINIKMLNRTKYKDLLKRTEGLNKGNQFVCDYAQQIGLDLSSLDYMEQIPNLKDKPVEFIDQLDALEACVEDLKNFKVIGIDLEFHGDKRIYIASLLQISTIEKDYVVDVLLLRQQVGPILSPVFGDPNIVKIFHGCDYDILLLLTDLEVEICNVFDTARAFRSMMKAATSSDPCLMSFEYLVSSLLGIKVNKFFQVAEWRLRPLPKVMLNYSRADSHYLHYIYAILIELMKGSDSKVVLPKAVYEDNKAWLDIRETEPDKWKPVFRDHCKKINKFMVQRIEKADPRTYQVIIHQ